MNRRNETAMETEIDILFFALKRIMGGRICDKSSFFYFEMPLIMHFIGNFGMSCKTKFLNVSTLPQDFYLEDYQKHVTSLIW